MLHEHPVKILKYALKNIWLLIFPLLRGLKTYRLDIDVFYSWIKGSWFDFIILLLIIGFGFLKWTNTWISFYQNDVTVRSGIFIKSETNISYSRFSVVAAERPIYLYPFKVVKIKIKTKGTTLRNSDINLLLRQKDARDMRHKIPASHKGRRKKFKVQPKILTIIFFSFLFSNSISGTAYIAAFFFQLGTVSKELLENELKYALEQITGKVSSSFANGIPPAAITVGILIIVTWLWSFIANILRYANFSMKKELDFIEVKMGALTRRSYRILKEKINYVDLRQNLIMKIFKKTSLNINCSGYGHKKNELPVLLPILSRKQANRALDLLDFGAKIGKRKISVCKKAVMTYLGLPLVFCIGIPALGILLRFLFPSYAQFVLPFAVMAEIPSVWMAAVKINALMTTGISVKENFICVRYSRFFTFHTIIVDRKKLVKAQTVQNPIQKMLKRCRLDLFFTSELPKINKLHGMNTRDAESIIRIFYSGE